MGNSPTPHGDPEIDKETAEIEGGDTPFRDALKAPGNFEPPPTFNAKGGKRRGKVPLEYRAEKPILTCIKEVCEVVEKWRNDSGFHWSVDKLPIVLTVECTVKPSVYETKRFANELRNADNAPAMIKWKGNLP